MRRRLIVGAIGGIIGMAAGLPLMAYVGYPRLATIVAAFISVLAIAIAQRLGWVKSSDEIHRPTLLFNRDRGAGPDSKRENR